MPDVPSAVADQESCSAQEEETEGEALKMGQLGSLCLEFSLNGLACDRDYYMDIYICSLVFVRAYFSTYGIMFLNVLCIYIRIDAYIHTDTQLHICVYYVTLHPGHGWRPARSLGEVASCLSCQQAVSRYGHWLGS